MRLKVDIEIPNWTKWLAGGLALGVVVGVVGARVYADTLSIKTTLANGEVLSAADGLNTSYTEYAGHGGNARGIDSYSDVASPAADLKAHTHGFSTASSGGGAAHNNMQPSIALNCIIKY